MGHVMDQQQQISKGCLNCPRCNSNNTKFCYYNNYSLSQPRHFCKACKRYWTRGGTLRNVPVGGGCRKNSKRGKSRIVLPPPPSSSPILVDAPLSSSNQVSQIPTSTIPATIQGASNNVLSPLLFGSYKDTMVHQQQQPRNIYSEMHKPNTIADPTHALSFSCFSNPIDEAYHSLQNVAPPSSTSRNQANELIKRLFPFQTMQQQLPSSITNGHHHIIGDQQQQAQRWSPNHDPQVSSTYTTLPWPHNHQANMDG